MLCLGKLQRKCPRTWPQPHIVGKAQFIDQPTHRHIPGGDIDVQFHNIGLHSRSYQCTRQERANSICLLMIADHERKVRARCIYRIDRQFTDAHKDLTGRV